MATIKRDMLTASNEWARHLRPYQKRQFWRGERDAGKQDAKQRIDETASLNAIDAEIDWICSYYDYD